jgi:DNA-binding MarR family transcriptional regulator
MKKIPYASPIEPIICLAKKFEAIGVKYIFKPMGLSPMNMKILQILQANTSLTSSQLISITRATKSNMSQRLSFLEKEGFISRNYAGDDTDKRKVLIQITKKGIRKITDIEKRIQKAQISFEKKFTQKEIEQHKNFFQKLNKIIDEGECELDKIFKQ